MFPRGAGVGRPPNPFGMTFGLRAITIEIQASGTVVTANHREIQMSDASERAREATFDSLMSQRNLGLDAESERRLHELLHALPAAVYTTDAFGRITFYNEAAATLWGCRPVLGSDEWCGSWKLYWPDGTPLPA